HPEADFRPRLHRILPAVRLFHSDAEQRANRLRAHGGAVFLSVLAVRPWGGEAAARLAVGKYHWRKFADGLHVELAQRSAAGIGYERRFGVHCANGLVPHAAEL